MRLASDTPWPAEKKQRLLGGHRQGNDISVLCCSSEGGAVLRNVQEAQCYFKCEHVCPPSLNRFCSLFLYACMVLMYRKTKHSVGAASYMANPSRSSHNNGQKRNNKRQTLTKRYCFLCLRPWLGVRRRVSASVSPYKGIIYSSELLRRLSCSQHK